MTCGAAVPLIAAAVEGSLALRPLDALVAHIEGCAACRAEADTQMMVKRLLGAAPQLPLPAGAAQRLAARLDREAERRRAALDWRARPVRLLSPAAALLLIAALVHLRTILTPAQQQKFDEIIARVRSRFLKTDRALHRPRQ